MDYKKIIRNREIRRKILRLASFIPDKSMLKIQYWIKTGRKLDLNNPKRFSEKIQWYKLYYKNPLMIQCVDKNDVREYVKSKGLNDILIPSYGVYETPDEINWDSLPNRFVLKDTLGGGGSSVIIVKDKSKESINTLINQTRKWTNLKAHVKSDGREWPYYSGKKHRIIIEQLIESNSDNVGLIDYKFFCFNGKIEFLYVMGYRDVGNKVHVGIYSKDFIKMPVLRCGDADIGYINKPDNFDEMILIAEKLAADFPHVRVDLYNNDGKILFGELTFYNASGYMSYEPDSFDFSIGSLFTLETYNGENNG